MIHRLHTTPPCPVCFRTLDAATNADDHAAHPAPGDLTQCLYCGTILVFTAGPFRVATEAECQEIDPGTRARMERLQQMRLRRSTHPLR